MLPFSAGLCVKFTEDKLEFHGGNISVNVAVLDENVRLSKPLDILVTLNESKGLVWQAVSLYLKKRKGERVWRHRYTKPVFTPPLVGNSSNVMNIISASSS